MSHNIDLEDEEAVAAEVDRRFALVFHNWRPGDLIPTSQEPIYKFSDSALQVGHFKEDVPGDAPSANRKKNAKAYLMVKRDGDKTGFLWCDADGMPVDKKYIQMAEGLVVQRLKEDLVEMYNFQEKKLVEKYNEDAMVTTGRRAIARCEARGLAEAPDGEHDLNYDLEEVQREFVLCSETDPELN